MHMIGKSMKLLTGDSIIWRTSFKFLQRNGEHKTDIVSIGGTK